MKIFLLFLLPLLIHSQKTIAQQKKNISSPYYYFQGSCDEINKAKPELYCLPIAPITFDDIFSPKYLNSKIEDINKWFEKNPFFSSKVEARIKSDNTIGIFTKDDLDFGRILYGFNEHDLLTPFSIDQKWENCTKSKELMALPPVHFEEIANLELIFALLMHLYWNKISEYLPLMRFFPGKIESPVFTLTPYELELLKGDEAYEKAIGLRAGYLESWDNFTRILKSHWSDEQMEVMFRQYEPIIEDFMYASMVASKFALKEKFYVALQRKPHLYIPLALFLFNHKIEEESLSFRSEMKKENDTDKLDRYLLVVKNTSENTELFLKGSGVRKLDLQIDPDDNYFLVNGYLLENNFRDCIDLYIMEETLAKSWGIPSIVCINLVNNRIMVIHAIGNLMNMNQKQYEACENTVFRKLGETVRGYEDEKVKIFHKCAHPEWTKFDIWERPLAELDEKIDMYEKKIVKLKKYIVARKKYSLPSLNGELMKQFFERRLNLCQELRKEIPKFVDNPKKFMIKEEL